MTGNIADDKIEFAIRRLRKIEKIIKITAGLVAIDAFGGNIETVYGRNFFGKQVLLDFFSNFQGTEHAVVADGQIDQVRNGSGGIDDGINNVGIKFFDSVLLVKSNDRYIAFSVINVVRDRKA